MTVGNNQRLKIIIPHDLLQRLSEHLLRRREKNAKKGCEKNRKKYLRSLKNKDLLIL